MGNRHDETLAAFDSNWAALGRGRSRGPGTEADSGFANFFSILPLAQLSGGEGFELGCGFGRMARRIAPHVGRLHCIEPSAAGLASARRAMGHLPHVEFHQAAVDAIPLADGSQDFGYSLGVLHHIPDTEAGLRACVAKLKPGAPFLLYLYYSLDNRPSWFRALWKASDALRRRISRLPFRLRRALSDALAIGAYWPLSRTARLAERLGFEVGSLPLSYYRRSSFATLRADSLDRFGTPLERRFSRREIDEMMRRAGLERIAFREGPPYWVAVGYKAFPCPEKGLGSV
jgi:SAM-dependent methyltransferase